MIKKYQKVFLTAFCLLISLTVYPQKKSTPIVIGEQIQYQSTVLKEDVLLDIHLPKDYSKENKYPVLYLLDGKFFFTQVVSIVDFLSDAMYVKKELIPKFIVVGITTKDRNKYFTPTLQNQRFPTSGRAKDFLKFIKDELFSYVESNFSTNNKRLLTGWSLGGLFTTYCYINHSELFDYYLAVSPSLWWDNMKLTEDLTKLISENGLPRKKFTMTIGALEKGHMPESIKASFLPVISTAAQPGFFNFIEIEGESHNITPLLAFYKGLQSLFYQWSIPEQLLTEKSFSEIEKLISEYALQFGFKQGSNISSEENTYNATLFLVDIAVDQINYTGAITLLKFITDKHPELAYPQYKLGELYFRSASIKNSLVHLEKSITIEKTRSKPNANRLKMYRDAFNEVSEEGKKKQ